jgi:hypothetical protein
MGSLDIICGVRTRTMLGRPKNDTLTRPSRSMMAEIVLGFCCVVVAPVRNRIFAANLAAS